MRTRNVWSAVCAAVMMTVLGGCASYEMPPFGQSDAWRLQGNTVINEAVGMRVNFGGESVFPLTNASNGDYDLHFVTGKSDFERYDPACAAYLKDVLKSIPMKIEKVDVMLADCYMIVTPSPLVRWAPDVVRKADGSVWYTQANPVTQLIQPHDELWRNLVINKSRHQIVVVDRMVKNGHHRAIVYVLQSEKKGVPLAQTFDCDILDLHNAQLLGGCLDDLFKISINALEK